METLRSRRQCPKSASIVLPKKLDGEVARLHLEKIGVPVEGPYKAEHYRY